jgi:hypothetical protein
MRAVVTAMMLAAVLAGCASVPVIPPEQTMVEKVVTAPNVPKDKIYEQSKVWFARTFRQSMSGWWMPNSSRTVIQYENRDKGLLIASGAIMYPMEYTTDAYKVGWEVRFTMEAEVRDGKARVTFGNLTMYVPTTFCGGLYGGMSTGSYEKKLEVEEFELVKPVFLGLADQLGAYLVAPEKTW